MPRVWAKDVSIMARKKKKSTRRRRTGKKKAKRSTVRKHSILTEGGAAVSSVKVVTDKTTTGASPIDAYKAPNPLDVKAQDILTRAGKNALAWDNNKYVIGGAVAHAVSKKGPFKLVSRPVNRMISSFLGKKWEL